MRVFMSDVSENFRYRLDWFKWLLVVVIISGSIYANWYYSEESLLYRVIGFLVAILISGFIASLTFRGKALINLCLLYTSPSPRDKSSSRMPSSA